LPDSGAARIRSSASSSFFSKSMRAAGRFSRHQRAHRSASLTARGAISSFTG